MGRPDAYAVEILATLAVVMGGYALVKALQVSGPLAMIGAGILIGNQGRSLAMSEQTRRHLDTFWELTDEFLNAFLFVMLGLEGLELGLRRDLLLAGLLLVPLVLLSRLATAGIPMGLLRRRGRSLKLRQPQPRQAHGAGAACRWPSAADRKYLEGTRSKGCCNVN